jgi:hypothetical protein
MLVSGIVVGFAIRAVCCAESPIWSVVDGRRLVVVVVACLVVVLACLISSTASPYVFSCGGLSVGF